MSVERSSRRDANAKGRGEKKADEANLIVPASQGIVECVLAHKGGPGGKKNTTTRGVTCDGRGGSLASRASSESLHITWESSMREFAAKKVTSFRGKRPVRTCTETR